MVYPVGNLSVTPNPKEYISLPLRGPNLWSILVIRGSVSWRTHRCVAPRCAHSHIPYSVFRRTGWRVSAFKTQIGPHGSQGHSERCNDRGDVHHVHSGGVVEPIAEPRQNKLTGTAEVPMGNFPRSQHHSPLSVKPEHRSASSRTNQTDAIQSTEVVIPGYALPEISAPPEGSRASSRRPET
ncbi:hypothetical protein BJ956_000568 [Arthrobacter psychrochitiniphilus]|nr:hypothetical protein [Arthrobacter psychrochitiniphilus]